MGEGERRDRPASRRSYLAAPALSELDPITLPFTPNVIAHPRRLAGCRRGVKSQW